jgi:hypothetical protein
MIDVDALFDALNAAGVDYVVVGGFAAMMHGSQRVTKDLDIVYHTQSSNLKNLCNVINALEPRLLVLGKPEGEPMKLTPEFLKNHPMLQLLTSSGPLDLLKEIAGFKSYAAIKNAAETVMVDEKRSIHVLNREGVLKSKRALKRPKDIEDIKQLEALAEIEAIDLAGQTQQP